MSVVTPVQTMASPQKQQHNRRQFYVSRIPVEKDAENFITVPSDDKDLSADSQEKFFTATVNLIDRNFMPKPPFRLPTSWVPIDHTSGLTLYLHKPTKVVTLARPYFAGAIPLRDHQIPLACIPCLAYRRGLEAAGQMTDSHGHSDRPLMSTRGVQTGSDSVDISPQPPQSAVADVAAANDFPAVGIDEQQQQQRPVEQEPVPESDDKSKKSNASSDAEEGEITTSEDEEEDNAGKNKSSLAVRSAAETTNSSRKRQASPSISKSLVEQATVAKVAAPSVEAKRPRLTLDTAVAATDAAAVDVHAADAAASSSLSQPGQAVCPMSSPVRSGPYLSHSELRQYCQRLFRYRIEQRQLCQVAGQTRLIQLPLVVSPTSSSAVATTSDPTTPQVASGVKTQSKSVPLLFSTTLTPPASATAAAPTSFSSASGRPDVGHRETPRSKLIVLSAEVGKRERIINPVGKMPASVIADLQVAPDRQFRYEYHRISEGELRCSLLSHDGRQLGVGVAKNKRLARHMAALDGLETLVPNFDQFKDDLQQHPALAGAQAKAPTASAVNAAAASSSAAAAAKNENEASNPAEQCNSLKQQPQPPPHHSHRGGHHQKQAGKSYSRQRQWQQQQQQQPPPPPPPPLPPTPSQADSEQQQLPADVPDDFKSIGSTDPRAVELLKRHKLPRMRCLLGDYMRRYCIEDSELRIDYSAPSPATIVASMPPPAPSGSGRHQHRLHHPHQQHACCLTLRGSQSGQCVARSKATAYDLAAQRLLAQAYPMAGSFYSILKLVGPLSHAAALAGQKNEFAEVQEQLKNSDRGTLKKGLLDMLRRKLRELGRTWTEYGPQFKGKFYDIPEELPRIEPHPDSALPTFSLQEGVLDNGEAPDATGKISEDVEPDLAESSLMDDGPEVAMDVEIGADTESSLEHGN